MIFATLVITFVYVVAVIALAVWSTRRGSPGPIDETAAATERCPRCRGRLAVVDIVPGRGQLLSCSLQHRWQVHRLANGGRVLSAGPPPERPRSARRAAASPGRRPSVFSSRGGV